MTEKYLRIDPSGEVSWINIDRVPYEFDPSCEGMSLDQIYAAIGCDCFEQVRTIICTVVMLVDESGKVKAQPQKFNRMASALYGGWIFNADVIVGPVILCSLRLTEPLGELDLFPLNDYELARVSHILGISIPDPEDGCHG